MTYQKVTIKVKPEENSVNEILIALLSEIDYEGFWETDDGLTAFIPTDAYVPLNKDNLPILSDPDHEFEITAEPLENINWNREWEKNYFKPLIIGDQCLIRSPFQKAPATCKYEILIEPRMAFGTGNHETTSLMLQHLMEADLSGLRILDMGCGTGILGILAAMKGARNVTGIDNDHWAVENARDNLTLTQIPNMAIELGDAQLLNNLAPFDIIVANINRNILLEDMEAYNKVLKPGGSIFLSGFYSEDLEKIDQTATQQHWNHLLTKKQNNWVAVSYRKQAD
jgi:ribosomal protein L11 methyltransferase